MAIPLLSAAELQHLRTLRRSRRFGWSPVGAIVGGLVALGFSTIPLAIAAVAGGMLLQDVGLSTAQIIGRVIVCVSTLAIAILAAWSAVKSIRRNRYIRTVLGCRHLLVLDGLHWQRLAYREMGELFPADDGVRIGRPDGATLEVRGLGAREAYRLAIELFKRCDECCVPSDQQPG